MAKAKHWSQTVSDTNRMTPDQLQDELVKLKKEQLSLRFQTATGQLEKTHRVAEVRRTIALVKTVMRQKARAAVAAAQADAGGAEA